MKTRLYRFGGLAAVLVALLLTARVAVGPEVARASRTRPPALAGSWYPESRARLVSAAWLLMRLADAGPALPSRPVAFVVPHAGWSFSGYAAGAAFRLLHPGEFDRVVVLAPSHHDSFRGYALDDAAAYRTPLGEVPLCQGITKALTSDVARIRTDATGPEHAVEIELPFLQVALGQFCLVPILVGDTNAGDQRAFAGQLAALDDGRTLFVFSSDFTHYGSRFGYTPFGTLTPDRYGQVRELNSRAVGLLSRLDTDGFRSYLHETRNTVCGRHGLLTMLELLHRIAPATRGTLLAHYMSADLPGMGEDSSVSYVSMGFVRGPAAPRTDNAEDGAHHPRPPLLAPPTLEAAPPDAPPVSREEGAGLVRLARAALETELEDLETLGPELSRWPTGREEEWRRGVFVTLNRTDPREIRERGRLRGCIGQPDPRFPLYYGTVQATLDAALRDPRFEPVQAAELGRLEVEVTVLSPRRRVAGHEQIRLGTHGIVLEKGDKAALFLPQVASENGWSLQETLAALSEKAGLPPDGWKEGARLSVFTGQVFEEER